MTDDTLRAALERIAYWEGRKAAPHGDFEFDDHLDCTVEEGCPAMVARAALASAPDEGPLLGFVNSDPNRPLDQEPRPATPAALDEGTDFNDAVKVIAEHGYAPVRLDRLNAALASVPDEGPCAYCVALDVERLLSAAHNHSWSNDCNLDGHNAGGGPAAGDECAECEHILDEYAARFVARPAVPELDEPLLRAVLKFYADRMPGYAGAAMLTEDEFAAVMVDVRRVRAALQEQPE